MGSTMMDAPMFLDRAQVERVLLFVNDGLAAKVENSLKADPANNKILLMSFPKFKTVSHEIVPSANYHKLMFPLDLPEMLTDIHKTSDLAVLYIPDAVKGNKIPKQNCDQ
ncbi:hypothetical protein AVEN_53076-1 [Araneus ventricosus]|uniref:Uncharacterized protein n=1 Tax=Araneus ventricosus TaxID=182803 RepID=A0A4Y2RU05_ARAVE|nr:hypothetical protein AVEN_53076-1 [Araneus ventricosus]